MDYEKKYNEALKRAKELRDKALAYNANHYVKDYETIFPELHEEEKPLTPFQQCLSHILYKVYYASAPGKVDKFILDIIKNRTDELVELAKRQEKTDCQLRESEDERMRKRAIAILKQQRDYWSYDGPVDKFPPATPRKDLVDAIDVALSYLEKQKEQKQNQSEEEREYVKTLKGLVSDFIRDSGGAISDVTYYQRICDWLDERHIEQKPAWSEEDETAFGDLMWCIEQARKSAKDENDMGNIWFAENWIKNRLKSLRPHWKPSEEQMSALNHCAYETCRIDDKSALQELYEQL